MDSIGKILIDAKTLKARVEELGKQISEDYKGKDLVLIGILKGAVIFLSDLAKSIDIPLALDFMAVSSYGASTHSSGVVRILKDLDEEIEGKDILIIEDIVDTGLTLHYLKENLLSRKPNSLKICCCLDKPSRRKIPVSIEYKGFDIPDEFVVGYGLDIDEKYRNLPDIYILDPKHYEK